MCKISKEELQESFSKIVEIDSKEPKISVALEEITDPMKCRIDSVKRMTKRYMIRYCISTGLNYNFFQESETFISIIDKELIHDFSIIRSLYKKVACDSIEEFFIWLNENEYKAICSFITLDKNERLEKISETTHKDIKELQNRYETIEENDSYEFFVRRSCIIVILNEIGSYIAEKNKERT